METYLCSRCGKRIDKSLRQCPDCGALNPYNEAVLETAVEQVLVEQKKVKQFSRGFLITAIIFGLALTVVHLVLMFAGGSALIFGEAFVGAVAGGFMVVMGIIGISKNEGVGKTVFIAFGISVWMLVMCVIFM